MFIDIENSAWHVYDDQDFCTVFDLRDLDGLRAFFLAHGTREVMCSSSVDYPEGVPEGFDGRECLAWALSWSPWELN